MEFSGVTKPIPPSSQSALQRTDAPMSAAAVRTQLPKDSAVQQVDRAAAMKLETRTGSQRQGMLAGLMQRALMLARARRSAARISTSGEQAPVSATDALRLRAYGGVAEQDQDTQQDIEHEDRTV